MYSKTKYRKYQRSKSQVFNGNSKNKLNTPTYYQQKGRAIQPNISQLYNPPMAMPNSQYLQQMYNTLVQYKYPFPKTIPNIEPFFINVQVKIEDMFPLYSVGNYIFTKDDLQLIGDQFLQTNFSAIANLYSWTFALMMIQFNHDDYPSIYIDTGLQYYIQWRTNLLQNSPYQIFLKTVSNAIPNEFHPAPISVRPNGVSSETGTVIARVERVSITSGSYTVSANNVITNDDDISDNGLYSFIDTSATPLSLSDATLEFVPSTGMEEGSITDKLSARLYILCNPHLLAQ